MSEVPKSRQAYLDCLKCFGIFAVVLGHMTSPLGPFIFSWHMPLFFLLAGFHIKINESYSSFSKREFIRLMVPYFIFAILGLLIEIAKRWALHRLPVQIEPSLKGIFWQMDIFGLEGQYGFVLWFLPALYWARIFYFGLKNTLRSDVLVAVLIVICFLYSFVTNFPFGIDQALNALIWVFIGHQLYTRSKFLVVGKWAWLAFFAICITHGVPGLDIAKKYYSNIFVNLIWGVAFTSFAAWLFSLKAFPEKFQKWVTLWGKETMILFIAHPYTNNAANLICEKLNLANLWYLELAVSLLFLQCLLLIKIRFPRWGVFRYV